MEFVNTDKITKKPAYDSSFLQLVIEFMVQVLRAIPSRLLVACSVIAHLTMFWDRTPYHASGSHALPPFLLPMLQRLTALYITHYDLQCIIF